MIKKCGWRNCYNFFSVGKKGSKVNSRTKYCCTRCCDASSKLRWKQANKEKWNASNNKRRNRRYKDPEYRARLLAKKAADYASLTPEEKTARYLKLKEKSKMPKGYHNEYLKKRAQKDPGFRIMLSLRARARYAVRAQGDGSKAAKTMELIGCSVPHLRAHLEQQFTDGMSWDNYGDWHIDHIKPCAAFDLTDPAQQRECFHYTNLQPLWASDNLSKGARYEQTHANV